MRCCLMLSLCRTCGGLWLFVSLITSCGITSIDPDYISYCKCSFLIDWVLNTGGNLLVMSCGDLGGCGNSQSWPFTLIWVPVFCPLNNIHIFEIYSTHEYSLFTVWWSSKFIWGGTVPSMYCSSQWKLPFMFSAHSGCAWHFKRSHCFDPEDEATTKILNTSNHLPVNMVHHSKRHETSYPVTDALRLR